MVLAVSKKPEDHDCTEVQTVRQKQSDVLAPSDATGPESATRPDYGPKEDLSAVNDLIQALFPPDGSSTRAPEALPP